jgi:uncharacterized protein (TIGR03437 family)
MELVTLKPILKLVAALAFPIAALADISQTTTLDSNSALNLDTGATVSSGGDILWNGATIAPLGAARAYNLGKVPFDPLTGAYFDPFKFVASSAPIPASALVATDVFVVFTNGGHTSKLLVNSNSGGKITLQFVTYIAAAPTGPTITAILNNSSLIPMNFPNYGIAPSSIFVIVGTGLADPGAAVLQSTADPGLPLKLNGASLSATVNSVTVRPAIYYTSPTRIAAVLPAATPIGTGTLTVTYNGIASAPAALKVVPNALGISTYSNGAVATDAITGSLVSYINSAMPGETLILWATGLGADPADSDTTYTSAPHSINVALRIFIGGVEATVVYAGASIYPGVSVLGVTIPPPAPTGCYVAVAAVIGGALDHVVTLPINGSGGVCVDPVTGFTGNQIAPPGGQTLRTGFLALLHGIATAKVGAPSVTNTTDGAFEKYTGLYVTNAQVSPGGCIINTQNPPQFSFTGLDAGTITLTGPNGLDVTLGPQFGIKGAFFANLPVGAVPQSGGTFTFKGTGGVDVGSFTSTFVLSDPILTVTSPSGALTIDRSQGLTVAWNGGNPGTFVIITGASTVVSGTTMTSVGFTCEISVDLGSFTVPAYILSALPAGTGGITVQNGVYAPLAASGLDISFVSGNVGYSLNATYK